MHDACSPVGRAVTCVEDGMSVPRTRVRLHYGADHVTEAYHWLLQAKVGAGPSFLFSLAAAC